MSTNIRAELADHTTNTTVISKFSWFWITEVNRLDTQSRKAR